MAFSSPSAALLCFVSFLLLEPPAAERPKLLACPKDLQRTGGVDLQKWVEKGGRRDLKISFTNAVGVKLRLLRVDTRGKEELQGTLPVGAVNQTLDTRVGHVWRARAASGELLLEHSLHHLGAAEHRRTFVETITIGGCGRHSVKELESKADAAWRAAHGARNGSALAHCPFDSFLGVTPLYGFHVICLVREAVASSSEGKGASPARPGLRRLCVFPDALESKQCPMVMTFNAKHPMALVQQVLHRLGVKLTTRQRPALFTGYGRQVTKPAELFPDYRSVLAVVEGGVWHWPPVRTGFKRVIGPVGDDDKRMILKTLSVQPRVFEIMDFLPAADRSHIEARSKPHLERSVVVVGGQTRVDNHRTAQTYGLQATGDRRVLAVERRVENLTRVPVSHGEAISVLKYDVAAKYGAHSDYISPEAASHDRPMQKRLQSGVNRMVTIFMYLSTVEGGETYFPRVGGLATPVDFSDCYKGLAVRPEPGKAILFYNMHPNGEMDPLSFHGGCTVRRGTKWSANIWLWNAPIGALPAGHVRPRSLAESSFSDRREEEFLRKMAARSLSRRAASSPNASAAAKSAASFPGRVVEL